MSTQPDPTNQLTGDVTGLVSSGVKDVGDIGTNLTNTFNTLVSGIPKVSSYGGVIMAIGGILLFLGLVFKKRFGGLSKEMMVMGGIAGLLYGAKLKFASGGSAPGG